MKIGIGVGPGPGDDGTIDAMIRQVQSAESSGFDSAWVANIFGVDAIMFLALAGRETSTIELGTGVVPSYPRHPSALAQQALTAAAACRGRFTLGIGLSHKVVIENMLGLDYSKPIRHTREYLSVLMPLLAGETVRFQGEEYRVNAQVQVAGATKPPVLVAALGPQMLKLAGKMADGTITWMGGPKYLAETAVPAIRAAAAEAGRTAPRIVAGFPIAVTSNVESARATASKTFAMYGTLPSYRAVLDVEGAADPASVAIVGTEKEVESQVRALAAAGVTDFNASPYPVEGDSTAVAHTIEFLASLAKAGV
ncbi:MAG: TIGR03564 family F420-dependent LLM class oxidoreductase [Dehalococcoidia bacterium]